jgi:hypothetical protein
MRLPCGKVDQAEGLLNEMSGIHEWHSLKPNVQTPQTVGMRGPARMLSMV